MDVPKVVTNTGHWIKKNGYQIHDTNEAESHADGHVITGVHDRSSADVIGLHDGR